MSLDLILQVTWFIGYLVLRMIIATCMYHCPRAHVQRNLKDHGTC